LSIPFVAAFLTVPDVIVRTMFAHGAFTRADASVAAVTLGAYAIGLIPFVLIRSAVATFYARKDTATPVKAALIGIAVNLALKVALMAPLAQVGLALGTAAGAWINLLLVVGFAVRAGHLSVDHEMRMTLAKFVATGVALASVFWAIVRLAPALFASLPRFHDEATLLLLIVAGSVIYAATIIVLFGRRWIVALVRG
jgi:putative peptidoglycan lipid II flippase